MYENETREQTIARYEGTVAKKPRKRNYINNPDLHLEMARYKKMVADAAAAGKPEPKVTDYIGKAIMHIATRLATKPNFSGYPFKEDMIMDGVVDALRYGVRGYNPDRETKGPPNPFAYLTQVIKNAFIRRIKEEKKILATKYKASQQTLIENGTYAGDMKIRFDIEADHVDAFLENYEASIAEGKAKAAKKQEERNAETDRKEREAEQ